MTTRILSVLALATLLAQLPGSSPAGPQGKRGQADDLSSVFQRWFRDFKAGKIEPTGNVWDQRQLYVPGAESEGQGRGRWGRGGGGRGRRGPLTNRLKEATYLFKRLVRRGTTDDGERLVAVIAFSLKKPGGRLWERGGRYTPFRMAAAEAMSTRGCPARIQEVVVTALRGGLKKIPTTSRKPGAGADDIEADPSATHKHSHPELATALLPIVGAFRQGANRTLLEACLQVDHSGMQIAAAAALADMGYGPSIMAVARALQKAKYADDITKLAACVYELVRGGNPPAKERQLKYALNLALDKIDEIKDWRAKIALVRVLRAIRSRGNIPVLIDLLARANQGLGKAANRSWSGTLLATIHDALVDLAGFYVGDPRSPQKWKDWWASVKDSFVIAERKSQARKKRPGHKETVASTFFGIPVSGNRVVFVLDKSRSMSWPFERVTVGGGNGGGNPGGRGGGGPGGGRQPPPGNYETKLDRARKELLRAVSGMTADSKFNVVFFADNVSIWKNKLVWANGNNRKDLEAYLNTIRADGSTALYDGMKRAMSIKLSKRRDSPYASYVDEIFVLSDGAPTSGEITETSRILQLVTDWNRGAQVVIHTIYIGGDDDGFGNWRQGRGGGNAERFMKELAERNHGKFVQPDRG